LAAGGTFLTNTPAGGDLLELGFQLVDFVDVLTELGVGGSLGQRVEAPALQAFG
jgi:hypothetical protein